MTNHSSESVPSMIQEARRRMHFGSPTHVRICRGSSVLPGRRVFLRELCSGAFGWCGAVGYRVDVFGLLAGGLAGDGFVGRGGSPSGGRVPWLDVLDHVGDLDCGEHGVDERAVALAACRAGVAGQREGEGPVVLQNGSRRLTCGFVEALTRLCSTH